RHVAAEFGRDHLGRAAGDAGDRVEPGERIGVRGGARLDLAIAHGDGAVEELDVAQEMVEEEAVVGRDAPGERLAEGGLRRRSPSSSRRASHSLSRTSVLRPGTIFTCWALTRDSSKRPSRML